MPRYYFHILDRQHLPDDLGVELADLDAAKAQALSFAGAVLADEKPDDVWDGSAWAMKVTDHPSAAGGKTLLTLMVIATVEAAP